MMYEQEVMCRVLVSSFADGVNMDVYALFVAPPLPSNNLPREQRTWWRFVNIQEQKMGKKKDLKGKKKERNKAWTSVSGHSNHMVIMKSHIGHLADA